MNESGVKNKMSKVLENAKEESDAIAKKLEESKANAAKKIKDMRNSLTAGFSNML